VINNKHYSQSAMDDKIKEVFDKYIPKFPESIKLKLPKIKRSNLKEPNIDKKTNKEELNKMMKKIK